MKKLLTLLISFFIIWGCDSNSAYKELDYVDSLMDSDDLDSISVAFNSVVVTDVNANDKDFMAYYNMLRYQLAFRKKILPPDDSLIDACIAYYKEKDDKEKLARSYYYKGRILSRRGKIKDATYCLKEAEEYSKKIDNFLLISRIKNSLANLNIDGGETKNAEVYCKQAIKYAELSGDKEQLLYSLNGLSCVYNRLGIEDSSKKYGNKCIPLIKYISQKNQAVFLANIASDYKSIDIEKAKEYVSKSLRIEELASTYRVLANIYLAEKNYVEAEKSWKRGLELCGNDLHLEINLLNDIRKYKHSIGESAEAALLSDKVIVLSDSLQRKWTNDSIKAVQDWFAAQQAQKASKEKADRIRLVSVAIILLLAVVLFCATYYNVRKRRKAKRIIAEQEEHMAEQEEHITIQQNQIIGQQEQLAEQQEQLSDYEKTVAASTRKIEKLSAKEQERKRIADNLRRNMKYMEERHRHDIDAVQHQMSERVAAGHRLWQSVNAGGKIVAWTKSEREMFVEYYKTVKPEIAGQPGLTPSMVIYLILIDMGKSEDEVMAIMGMTLNSIRTMKSRMKSNK